ncbi:flavodoxin family protein [Nocardioides currus]|uniref:NADPH-dependent oxidoreductase n=1 Tax=Nocardioides currus TaxID=2133958 RepID=A0A2R7Z059_9ACTN|nr:NAD(P)H-dependent oxidoreductase [Nocardioides currus]PUA81934.1 NADPH-dependent oxidoreductase [Nocardioides currus]
MAGLTAVVLVCTLKKSPARSSSELIGHQLLDALGDHDISGEVVRVVDHDVRFGVSTDEGDGDGWPAIRERIVAADIVVLATPIWMGQPPSVTKMVLERLDAELSETDETGRPSMSDKVALVGVVGNEDGAHHVAAECFQALNDVGFTVAASASAYWVGEAMGSTDYQDLDEAPEKTRETIATAAANAAHLAAALRTAPYPAS